MSTRRERAKAQNAQQNRQQTAVMEKPREKNEYDTANIFL